MNASTRWLVLFLSALSLAAAGTVWAQSGGGFDARVNTFDAGGGRSEAGGYVLQSAAGQPIAGGSDGASYDLNAGVIREGIGAASSPSPTVTAVPSPGDFKGYLPHVAKDGTN